MKFKVLSETRLTVKECKTKNEEATIIINEMKTTL